ncbi:tape measure protein [Ruminiclostridium papyrosolvens]|uniref:Tape measure protein N-terminal domain-containing protein n=1 Tax=Ruminiclostridium papyrosolvens C7 TaxID=1330534 RepID=U4R284_9FIRM|nr:tape measure protein [Ruminiclostridium papyrosolvens]EPR12340.1 hypothetical protein L323_08520 [Ruminiclostridium papyrosolvens C7]
MATVANSLQLIGGTTTALSTVVKPVIEIIDKTQELQNQLKKPFNMSGFREIANVARLIAKEFYAVQDQVKESIDSIEKMAKVKDISSKISSGMEMVDKYSNQNARLSMMTDKRQSTGELQHKVYSAANNSRSTFDSTAATVTKLGLSAKGRFKDNNEILGFTELMNKSFAGAESGEATKGIDKITDAMVSGNLKGEDMASVFQNAPAMGRAVSNYTGQSQQQLIAGNGVSAEVLKNSVLSAYDQINAKFATMPVTFQQIGSTIKNTLFEAFIPVLQAIANAATWVYNNWATVAPVFWGIAAAAGAYAIGLGISTIATTMQKIAQDGLNASLFTSPLFWIALVIGVIIGLIYKWVQSVGGIHVAWLIVVNAILILWDALKISFFTGVYWVIDLWNLMMAGMKSAGVAIQNFMGDMRVGVLTILQNMVNGAIDIINKFIGLLNKVLPEVSIKAVSHVTFGTEAKIQNEAEKAAREADLKQYNQKIDSIKQQHDVDILKRQVEAGANMQKRQDNIENAKAQAAKKDKSASNFNVPGYNSLKNPASAKAGGIADSDTKNHIANTAANTGAMKDSMQVSEEDLKYMRDIAEQEVVNKFTTAEIKVDMTNHNNINSNLDLDGIVSYMEQKVYETMSVAAEGVYN